MMSNFPAPREIPQGKVLLAEYGSFPASERAIVQTIASAHSTKIRAAVSLVMELAGLRSGRFCRALDQRLFRRPVDERQRRNHGPALSQRRRGRSLGARPLRSADGE